jgi:hypothetical protein
MFTHSLAVAVTIATTEGPAPEDVKAGWVALIIFLLLVLAVAFLGWSLTKQLRKAQAAKDAGAYGDKPAGSGDEPADGDSTTSG